MEELTSKIRVAFAEEEEALNQEHDEQQQDCEDKEKGQTPRSPVTIHPQCLNSAQMLATAISETFSKEWKATCVREAEADLARAIAGDDPCWPHGLGDSITRQRKRLDRIMNGTEPVFHLMESDGKLPGGDKIMPEPGRDNWGAVMLNPTQDLSKWVHEAMVLINYMSPEQLSKHVNDRGGYFLNGNGPWAGMSALHYAVETGYPGLTRALLEIRGVDINIRDALGRTPLQLAFTGRGYNVKIVTALIEHGAAVGIQDNRGDTPLHTVILFHDEPDWLPLIIMDHLTDYDYNQKDEGGKNLLERVQTWAKGGKRGSIIKKIKLMMVED